MKAVNQERYRIHEFARLVGVTVRALHQFDRLGLLKPAGRSSSGYRVYTTEDFVTLHQIVMLKFMGFTPEEIKRLITWADLSGARAMLEQKQQQLTHVIQAVREAQELPVSSHGHGAGWQSFAEIMARI